MSIDTELLQLQYEILNASVSSLATEAGVSEEMMQEEIDRFGWTRLFPGDDAEEFSSQENYIEANRRRLKVYSLAKEIFLAKRYLALEASIVKTAQEIVDSTTTGTLTPQALKQLSALYKDMTSGSNLANLASMTLTQDDNGLPMVIVRDVSGTK